MLQGTAEKMHPLDALSITSACKQSFAGYLLGFTVGEKKVVTAFLIHSPLVALSPA